LFSLLETAASGLLAAIFIIALIKNHEDNDSQMTKYAMAVAIGYSIIASIVCITSFAGLVGAIAKKAGAVRTYAATVGWLLWLQVIWGIIGIVALWLEPQSAFIHMCESGQTDADVVNTCTGHITEVKGVATGLIVLSILLHAYQLHVIKGYATELERGRYELSQTDDGSFVPPTSYAYASNAHSYGNHDTSYA